MALVAGAALSAEAPGERLPDGPEKAVVIRTCNGCHLVETLLGRHNSPKYWDKEIEHMIDRGARGKPEDFDKIRAYVKRNFGYVPGAVPLPDAPGKAELMAVCSKCHGADIVVTRDGHDGTRARWSSTIERMIRLGSKGTDAQYDAIVDYLTKNVGFVTVVSDLPQWPGKDVVDRDCGACHGTVLFWGRHEARANWLRTIENMMGRGAMVTPEEGELMADYLTKFFGPDNLR